MCCKPEKKQAVGININTITNNFLLTFVNLLTAVVLQKSHNFKSARLDYFCSSDP